jgi:anionic cell wall polymer biosynthesis LytR-Cps2A-Psr (LCP) family protein
VRKRYNDLTRADNQTLVLCSLKAKLTSAEVLPKVPDLISAFQGSIQTDLSLAQLSQLACLAPQLTGDNLTFLSFPEEIYSPSRAYDPIHKVRTFVFDVDFDVMRDYVDQFMAGTWEAEEGGAGCP